MSFKAITPKPVDTIRYPFGSATSLTPSYDDTLAVSVTNTFVYIKPATLTGNTRIDLTIASDIKVGAFLMVEMTSDTTGRNTVFGNGFTCPTLSGTASKTKAVLFVFNGTSYIPAGTPYQIN